MKEIVKKDLPEVSGGDFPEGGCIPIPGLPGPDSAPPFPVYDSTTQVDV